MRKPKRLTLNGNKTYLAIGLWTLYRVLCYRTGTPYVPELDSLLLALIGASIRHAIRKCELPEMPKSPTSHFGHDFI